MPKTIEQNFIDWEAHVFGFSYGSGEPHIMPALKTFLELCNEGDLGHSYDYKKLENALGKVVAWLLINTLCQYEVDVIEYGSSPRHAWLTPQGKELKAFVATKTAEELVEIVTEFDPEYVHCYPEGCNCGEHKCVNPFWVERT